MKASSFFSFYSSSETTQIGTALERWGGGQSPFTVAYRTGPDHEMMATHFRKPGDITGTSGLFLSFFLYGISYCGMTLVLLTSHFFTPLFHAGFIFPQNNVAGMYKRGGCELFWRKVTSPSRREEKEKKSRGQRGRWWCDEGNEKKKKRNAGTLWTP